MKKVIGCGNLKEMDLFKAFILPIYYFLSKIKNTFLEIPIKLMS